MGRGRGSGDQHGPGAVTDWHNLGRRQLPNSAGSHLISANGAIDFLSALRPRLATMQLIKLVESFRRRISCGNEQFTSVVFLCA